MKKKNLFILIALLVLLVVVVSLFALLKKQKAISPNHFGIVFEIHNCPQVETSQENLRNIFLRPLLRYSLPGKEKGIEKLIIPNVSCDNVSFSIPALGINAFRYNEEAITLNESSMTWRGRKIDDDKFFTTWEGDGFNNLERNLLKGLSNYKNNNDLPSLSKIMQQDASDKIIQDSIIIDKDCQKEESPYLFASTENARKYIDGILAKNPNAIIDNQNRPIRIFVWCGQGYLLNENDRDNDGVINEQDNCPDESGEKTNGGCPIKEDLDKDGVYDEDDACPKEKGDKACDGCPCPPPIVQPDDDKDGIPNSKDKCPSEFGFKRYNGCPIPDRDGDEINDELDKCPKEKGPKSNDGCPISLPKIKHNNYDGKFIIEGIKPSDLSKYKINMVIYQSKTGFAKGANRVFPVNSIVFPSHDEANNIINALKDPVELEIVITISDLSGNKITSMTFSDLNMVCTPGGECGFKNLD